MTRFRRAPSVAGLTLLVLLVELGLRILGLRRLCAALGIRFETQTRGARGGWEEETGAATEAPQPSVKSLERVERWARRVDSVVNRGPKRGRCLRRALSLGFLLRDLRPVLRIGVAGSRSSVDAHAWLEIDGRAVAERPSAAHGNRFIPLRGVREACEACEGSARP